jgi:hypothetical protein
VPDVIPDEGAGPDSASQMQFLWLLEERPQPLASVFTAFAHRVTVIFRTAILRARRLGL